MAQRTCRYCRRTYQLNKDNFGHNPQGGFRWKCRACVRQAVREYNEVHSGRAYERTQLRNDTRLTQADRARYGTQLARRDGGYTCFYCKEELGADFHIDHKTPIAKGGQHALANFALACMPCNQEKHAKDINEYRVWRRDRGLSILF
ncbi:HNH endonuclease [Bradyrhizobium cosmicum]|uniref:HNH endonuclease n=1 Tax=Bradyrhizobium cosmicum TaxID=1404864 RepID=A0AAI8MIZ0_9BRAD|nr:putative HNH endonuclease [Bradyrhizobium cosmicum]